MPMTPPPPPRGQSLGLTDVRNYCQAYGIFISGVMDTQRTAADWLTDLAMIGNCAPVWNGSLLLMIPRCEVSFVDNGAYYLAPTSSGPVADLDDSVLMSDAGPPVTIIRKRNPDAYNILPIEHIDRVNDYHTIITTIRDQGDILRRGPIKASVLQLHWIHDQGTATKVGWPLVRRQTLIERLEFDFDLPWTYSWLDPMDLVTLTDKFLGLNKTPVRITSIKETQDYKLQCTAEPFYYGAHSPTPESPTFSPIGTSFNQNADPGSVNPPIIFEAVAALNQFNNQGAIWVTTTGSDPNYGGCDVLMSTDGGNTYKQVGVINRNPIMGTLASILPFGTDPDSADTIFMDFSGIVNTNPNDNGPPPSTTDMMNNFQSVFYIEGGGAITRNGQNLNIPYELISYADSGGTSTPDVFAISPPFRRGVFGTPIVQHNQFSRVVFVSDTQAIIQIPLDQSLIGKQLFFKLTAFNTFLQEIQNESDPAVLAYAFTPTGQVGSSQIQNNQQQQGYTTTPSQLVLQGKSGGQPGHPSFTDPTKIYIVQPFTANFSQGAVVYSGLTSPQAIPAGPFPLTLYVSVFDPSHTGTGPVHVDTNQTNFNTAGYTRVGQIVIADVSSGGATASSPGQRNMYATSPAPDGSRTIFGIVGGTPSTSYIDVYINGIIQAPSGAGYSFASGQIVFVNPPLPGDVIQVVF